MPLQALAAANMLVCNSLMQAESQAMQNMPCHEDMNTQDMDKQDIDKQDTQKSHHQQTPCKTVCATLCAGLNAMATLPVNISAANYHLSTPLLNLPNQVYASITQPNLQRPPIFLA